jgi:hypothetical protein
MIRLKTLLLEQVTSDKIEKQIQFDSGYHSEQTGKLDAQIGPDLEKIKQFLVNNQDSDIQIRLASSESKVPNRDAEKPGKPKLAEKELSRMRYVSIKSYMTRKLQEWLKQGVIKKMPSFVESEPIIGGPDWNPTGGDKASDEKFKKHQYLKVFVEVKAEPAPGLEMKPMNSNSGRSYGATRTENMKTTFAYGYNNKWLENGQWVDVDKFSVPSRMLTNAGPIILKTDMSKVGGPAPFNWKFEGDSNCQKVKARSNYDKAYVNTDCNYCDSYKVIVNGSSEPTAQQWQYIYMYVKKEENHYKHKDWSFISNKPAGLKPNLRLNGTPNTGGYSEDTRVYYK